MDHADLVAELPSIISMEPAQRIALAKQRRIDQRIRFDDYDAHIAPHRRRNPRLVFKSGIALLEATSRGDIKEVEELLQANSDPNSHNEDGLTPLHQCAIDNNEQLVRLLIHYEADVNAKDTELWTPLHAAACCGYIEIVRLLIANGADLLAVNTEGNMPYDICDDENTLDVIESEMAARGITQELIDQERAKPERQMLADMKLLHQQGQPLDVRQPDGSTYLHAAAANGYYDVVAFLLRVGFQPTVRDNDYWTPVHAAAHWNQPEIIEMLCEYGADINVKTATHETPLELAEDANTKAVIQNLINSHEAQKKKRLAFGVRDSRRQSRRKKKYESPGQIPGVNGDNPFSARGAIRRQSLRDRSGVTPARLEAAQEQSNLIRSWSREDVANHGEGDVSQYHGGRYIGEGPARGHHRDGSPQKRNLRPSNKDNKATKMSPDEWLKQLNSEPYYDGDEDLDNNGGLNRSQRGRSGSRKKKKKTPNEVGDHELADMRNTGIPSAGGVPMNGGSSGNAGGKSSADREKSVCCCTIL
uniref:ANK_REP_REGION domain-containing protein n=1 Tax=Panagrellus redivivus TaxID=6233 RepID=A0A7E4UYC6_PANRE